MRTAKRLFSINVSIVRAHLSISLDGYGAGPNQSLDNPIGEGGMRLHEWVFPTAAWRGQQGLEGGEDSVDSGVAEEVARGVGAYVMLAGGVATVRQCLPGVTHIRYRVSSRS
jgi:hypothetical protein